MEDLHLKHVFTVDKLLFLNLLFELFDFFVVLGFYFTDDSQPDHVVVGDFDLGVLFDLMVFALDQFLDVDDVVFVA